MFRAACLFLTLALAPPLLPATRGVEILWDRFGVAHVYAKNVEGLFFGYGYAQMQSHANLILKLYGESRGRAAEYWGEKNLELTRWVLTNDVPERGEAWYRQQTPEFRGYLDAFAAGMNEYATRHPDAIAPEMKQVLPISPADPVIHVHRIVHFSYISSRTHVVAAATGKTPGPDDIGSNAWSIAPKRTANGHTLMVMNPHLPWMDWYTYYEIHLNAPGLNLYGASQIGFPMLRFVFSDYLGFTQTTNNIDGSDLYRITPKDDGYWFDGRLKQFEVTEKRFRIRNGDGSLRESRLVIRKTIHGPVVWDQDGKMLALRTAALDRPFLIEQYWKMAIAHNLGEYETQVKRLQVPTFNITYGDRDGHVMYLFNGTLPVRKKGDLAYWAGVLPGDTSETLWTSVHPYEDLPKVIDPPTGWVQNTNDPPWTATYPVVLDPARFPSYVAGQDYSFRTRRSIHMLNENSRMTFDQLVTDKLSTRLELADRVLDDLLAAVEAQGTERAREAAAILKKWNRDAENDSRGTLLFEAWAKRFLAAPNFAVPATWSDPLKSPRGLKDPAGATRMLDEAAGDVKETYGVLDAPWGDFMRLRRGATDLPGNGAGGSLGAFRVLQYGRPQGNRKQAFMGDTFVACVEFSNPPHAQVLVSYGNSSQPGSPHAEDQLPLLSQKKLRNAWRTRKDVDANLESKDVF